VSRLAVAIPSCGRPYRVTAREAGRFHFNGQRILETRSERDQIICSMSTRTPQAQEIKKITLFRPISTDFGPRGKLFIILGNPQHDRSCAKILHLFRDVADFFGAFQPVVRIVVSGFWQHDAFFYQRKYAQKSRLSNRNPQAARVDRVRVGLADLRERPRAPNYQLSSGLWTEYITPRARL
jgi:hypothetical protein